MTPKPTRQPPSTDNLIQITVTLNASGPPTYTALYYLSGRRADPAKVRTADSVSWIVKLVDRGGLRPVPFSLKFHDPSIFGVSTLSVPHPGFSDPIQALSLGGSTKYDIALPESGITIDPEIQVDNSDTVGIFVKSDSRFIILWEPASNAMSFNKDSGEYQPFPSPLIVSFGDKVMFEVATKLRSGFAIDFQPGLNPGHIWASPFDQNQFEFAGHAGPVGHLVTDDLSVQKVTDQIRDFVFVASLRRDRSAAFTIQVNKPAEPEQ